MWETFSVSLFMYIKCRYTLTCYESTNLHICKTNFAEKIECIAKKLEEWIVIVSLS